MPTPAAQLSKDDQHSLHPSKKNHRPPSTPKPHIPTNIFMKKCDDDAAAARTSPRVSPDTRMAVGKGYHRCPSGRSSGAHGRSRIGGERAARDFSRLETTTVTPDNRKCTAQHAAHQPVPPRSPHQLHRLTETTNTRLGGRTRTHRARGQPQRSRQEGTTSTATFNLSVQT